MCSYCRDRAIEHGCTGEVAQGQAASDGLPSADPPSDQEEAEEEEAVIASAQQLAKDLPEVVWPALPANGLVRHRRYCTLHAAGSGPFKTACGLTLLEADFEALDEWPGVPWPICRRRNCFK